MKKIILLVSILALIFTTGFASELNYEDLSTDDLLRIHREITEEITKRFSTNVLVQGTYEEGVSIAKGEYVFTCSKIYDGKKNVAVNVSGANDSFVSGDKLAEGESCLVSIEEGGKVLIGYGECIVTPLIGDYAP